MTFTVETRRHEDGAHSLVVNGETQFRGDELTVARKAIDAAQSKTGLIQYLDERYNSRIDWLASELRQYIIGTLEPATCASEFDSEQLKTDIESANRLCGEWERTKFNLGTMVAHTKRLKDFASDGLLRALRAGVVGISGSSAYDAPRFYLKEQGLLPIQGAEGE